MASLRDFTRNVVVNEFGGAEPTPLILDALVGYMLEFDWLPAPLLKPDGTLKHTAPEPARRGEILFNKPFEGMGGRACSSCHTPSSNFLDGRQHDIGSGKRSSPDARDSFFDTPTLINVKYTAPYFHDGALDTLGDVVQWFNENHALGLDRPQAADLTAYLEAVGTADQPYEIFDDQNTRFGLDWSELSTFLTTLDTLIEARDARHATVLLNTVEPDLRVDVSGAVDLAIAPMVYEIADKLVAIEAAIAADDWSAAAALNHEYKALAAKYGPRFK